MPEPGPPGIHRHKTALHRHGASAPIKSALSDGVILPGLSVFDFGCGRGTDVDFLRSKGISCDGWDPAFRSDVRASAADVVNLGYVINVIEDPSEREATLRRAWELCRRTLIVSAQILVAGRGDRQVAFGDGILTRRGTFQKFFTQHELREYIDRTLGAKAIPAAPGMFYVFRDDESREEFLESRCRRRPPSERRPAAEMRFDAGRDLLLPLMQLTEELGRLPDLEEFDHSPAVVAVFGSLKRAFRTIRQVTGTDRWNAARKRRTEDLLVYLALARFRRRPPVSQLPISLQRDMREFFGSYKAGCSRADELLTTAGAPSAIDAACRESPVGKLLPNALYVHRSALSELDPLLRIYEGCARSYIGEIAGANIVKLHRFSGKVSYLAYPHFDSHPHPALLRSVKLSLRTQTVECYDYDEHANPPILHRKETFLAPTYPRYEAFAQLSRKEESCGLLADTATIGTRDGWEARLREAGFTLRGHRLTRIKDRS